MIINITIQQIKIIVKLVIIKNFWIINFLIRFLIKSFLKKNLKIKLILITKKVIMLILMLNIKNVEMRLMKKIG